jgi:glycosyltransferase involved in cell wall biosynthesis
MEESISVVIPTCNRKERVLDLLVNLALMRSPVLEVIVVDSGEDRLDPADYAALGKLNIQYVHSPKSVCIQRNTGIRMARGKWIFLCDDDIRLPFDYLSKLMMHYRMHPQAGAISGLVLQRTGDATAKGKWTAQYPIESGGELLRAFIFRLGIWGEIKWAGKNPLLKKIKAWYIRKGNHISKAGWPVITDFSGEHFVCPVFGLGASLIKRAWLLQSPYDEVLDPHGIGDNYGVSVGFPPGIHVLTKAFVYHDHEQVNRLKRPLQYYRRALALDYFRKTKKELRQVKKYWLLWSLLGNLLTFILVKDRIMIKAAFTSLKQIALGRNPYYRAARQKEKVVRPMLE